ncbi:MAG: hypothetical protein ACM3UY_03340 [Methanocella sp.]
MHQINKAQFNLPTRLKVAILIIATAFLAYSIYWLVNGIIWGYTLTYQLLNVAQAPFFAQMGTAELTALVIQEYCSVTNSFVLIFCGAFAFQSAVYYVRNNENYLRKLGWALILLAIFSLLLIPASIHHLLGVALGWHMVDILVGLSYLVQALLILPPLLVLGQKLNTPQNMASIKKWALIAAPTFVFALYFKYLFLWADTLLPMGPKTATAASTVGALNSMVTLAIAGAITIAACYALHKRKNTGKNLAAVALILVGGFFIIYSLVALFVPVYAWFWYLTDTWMLTLPILGIALLTQPYQQKRDEKPILRMPSNKF